MAEKRKLLVEMDKVFKKIDEGLEVFEETMTKMTEANSDNQRDKLQDDLKKEIKKLQRLREQIKGWQNSSDIKESEKDKEKLNYYRKLIEQRMETFKDVEREFKTKPHSKQGLSAEEKLDPKEKEKAGTLEWLNNQIRTIQDEIDKTESKIESFSTPETGKKRGKGKDDKRAEKEKVDELMKHLKRVKFHLQNLEVCMRMITNEKIAIKDVINKLKEPLDLYIDALDSGNEDDPATLEPDDIYEELGLSNYISQLSAFHPVDEDKIIHKIPLKSPTRDERSKMIAKPVLTSVKVQKKLIAKPTPSSVTPFSTSQHTAPVFSQTIVSSSNKPLPMFHFTRLEMGTLLFLFYYMENSQAQYLSAKALKELSWRFHTRYLMWFQRIEDPREINAHYERGSYVYFDYTIWNFRHTDDFVFQYKYLEDYEL